MSDHDIDSLRRRLEKIGMVKTENTPRVAPVPNGAGPGQGSSSITTTHPVNVGPPPLPPPRAAAPSQAPPSLTPGTATNRAQPMPCPPVPAPPVLTGRVISSVPCQDYPPAHAINVSSGPTLADPLFSAQALSQLPSAASGAPLRLNEAASAPSASPSIPGVQSSLPIGTDPGNSLLTSLAYHVDRMANPDTSIKPGTIENIRRNEEIHVYVARLFDNNTVALCPGVYGKSLAQGHKSLNGKRRPLYDQYRISGGFSNRIFISADCLYWGCRDKEEDYYLEESDCPTGPTREFDKYTSPSGWTIEARARASHPIETWKINAANMSRMFAAVYGAELMQGRLAAIEYLRSLHIDYPRKYTLSSLRSAWGTLNYRWVQELRDMTNTLRMHAQVERPTFAQLRAIGMTVITATSRAVYQRPTAFNLADPKGYFATEIVRRMKRRHWANGIPITLTFIALIIIGLGPCLKPRAFRAPYDPIRAQAVR